MKLKEIEGIHFSTLPEFQHWFSKPLDNNDFKLYSKFSNIFGCNREKFRALWGKSNYFQAECRNCFWVVPFGKSKILVTTSQRGSSFFLVTEIQKIKTEHYVEDVVDFLNDLIEKL